jgi:alkylhydroperoxidase family enzyme
MPANVFNVFMSKHGPIGELVDQANTVLWEETALDPVIKERMRIALAETIGCSYCARFRTDDESGLILERDGELSEGERRRAELAEAYARAVVESSGEPPDELTVLVQSQFTPAEFTDLVFSMGWFIGMQHVGRVMHWDNSCPVAPIRKMVEAGEAA